MEQFEMEHKLMILEQDRARDHAENQKKLSAAQAKYQEQRLRFEAAVSAYELEKARYKEEEAIIQALYTKKKAEICLSFDKEHGFSQ